MKRLLIALCLASSVFAASPDEAGVLLAEKNACIAFQKSDVAGLEAILTDDFTLTAGSGEVQTKATALGEAKAANPRYTLFENRDQKVRLYGDAAVVTGRTVLKGTQDGKAFEVEVQFTDTLVKRKGKWLLAAGHVTRIGK